MLITGMAAGFGGLFQTPLAAVFFAMEVIVAGYLEYDALLPALIAAYTASFTSHFLGLEKFAVDIQDTWTVTDLRSMISLIALGLAFGLAGRCFSVLLQKAKKLFGEKISTPLIRIGIMAIPLAALLFVIHGGRYTGLGTNLISASFAGETIYGYDWILKLLFTVFTLAIGFQGGEVTPLFSIGAPSSPRSSSAWKSSAPETPSPLSWYASSLIWSMEITPFMEHSRRRFAGLRSRYVHIFYSVMADSVVTE